MKWIAALVVMLIAVTAVSAQYDPHKEYTYETSHELEHLVEWQEYSQETFDRAIEENKPVYFVLTAVWCYWCHVYESEDFLYDPNVYPYLNENLVPVLIDADKRRDLTRQYLEGGWPSTTVFTPDGERLAGFSGPRDPATLLGIMQQSVAAVDSRGGAISIPELNYREETQRLPTQTSLRQLTGAYPDFLLRSHDDIHGGFGTGQKFPQGYSLNLLLDAYEDTENDAFLNAVVLTFENQNTKDMENDYNLYDPIEGGFHRYGVDRDWTPPHYEKMLYDNARLILTYAHLYDITGDAEHREIAESSAEFILREFYDEEHGGFAGSQDAGEHYFPQGESGRAELEVPYIDRTKYTEWNSEMIITFFALGEYFEDDKYTEAAVKSIDFFVDELLTDEGVLHYYDPLHDEKKLDSQIVDNAWFLLALVEAYERTGDEKYLDAAEEVAEFSFERLYDWNVGGFFERNSRNADDYVQRDMISLSKPAQENGVMIYALARLYTHTDDVRYLNAALKSYGLFEQRISGLDRSIHFILAAQYFVENGLMGELELRSEEAATAELSALDDFFLPELLERYEMPEVQPLPVIDTTGNDNTLAEVSIAAGLLIAFISGLISFLSPCTLPVLSAYFAYGLQSDRKRIVANTTAFLLGLALLFTLLGMTATTIGGFLTGNRGILIQISGVIIVGLGLLQFAGKGFSMPLGIRQFKKNVVGSFLFGAFFGVGWSACIAPILASILIMASTADTVVRGGILLFVYALGLGLPLILLSWYIARRESRGLMSFLEGKLFTYTLFGKKMQIHTTNVVAGILLVLLGIGIFTGLITSLNNLVPQWFIASLSRVEDVVLQIFS